MLVLLNLKEKKTHKEVIAIEKNLQGKPQKVVLDQIVDCRKNYQIKMDQEQLKNIHFNFKVEIQALAKLLDLKILK